MSFKALQKSEKIINLIGVVIIVGLVLWALSFAIGILGSIGEDRKKARAAEALVKRPTLVGVISETADIPTGFTTHDAKERRKHYPFWFKLENDPDGLVTYYFNTGTYNFRTYDEWDFFDPYTKVNNATRYTGEALHLRDLLPVGSRVTFKVFQNEGLTRQVYDVIKIEPPVTTETASSEKHLESFRTHAEKSRRITQDFIAHIDSETTTREQEQQFIRASLRAWEAQVKMASD
tara:strand:- start:118 stop:819 length:702 start_codon:yes stop_codon:yes gene_type:complete